MGYGIGLPLNSPYKDALTNAILKLRENGFLDKLKIKWFVQKGTCAFESEEKSKAIIVYLEDIIGVYVLVACGVVLGLIALVVEWIYFTRKLVKNSESVRKEGRMDGRTDGRTDRQTGRQTDRKYTCIQIWTEIYIYTYILYTHRQIDRQTLYICSIFINIH